MWVILSFSAAVFFGLFSRLAWKRHKRKHHHHRRATFLKIYFEQGYRMNTTTIVVGLDKTAKVVVFDQNHVSMPYDFGANPPFWGVDQPSNVGLSAGPTPDVQILKGVAVTATQAVLSVTVPGVVNGTATAGVDVVEPPQVATSVEITFE